MQLLDYSDTRETIRDLDVLAFAGRGFVSRCIRRVTGGEITHVGLALWVGDELMLVESREFRGNRIVWLSREIRANDVRLYRPKTPIPDRASALQWLRRAPGSPYSMRGVLRFIPRMLGLAIGRAKEDSLTYEPRFCSAFVSAVYRIGGLYLVPGVPDDATDPATLVADPHLELIGKLQYVPKD